MRLSPLHLAYAMGSLSYAAAQQAACTPRDLTISTSSSIKITNLQAEEVKGYGDWSSPLAMIYRLPHEQQSVDFCNVTVSYTHPGTGDNVNVYVWLPLNTWNERLVAMGGGGLAGGIAGALIAGVSAGYASVNTDSGHTMDGESAETWALKGPGSVDWQLLYDFTSVTLDDMTAIAKSVVKKFYGKPPKYSYWNGCSNGGRQGLVQAQQYPTNYDGILAAAPAIGIGQFIVTMNWAHVQMLKYEYVPPPCELSAIHEAAIDACDHLDGVRDGVVSAPNLCSFQARSAVGATCCDGTRTISEKAATIAQAVWDGPSIKAQSFPSKLGLDVPFGTEMEELAGLAKTICDSDGSHCRSVPFSPSASWITYFSAKDPAYNPLRMTEKEFHHFLRSSMQEYSTMNADWPDLSEFRAAGGKMITWHGLADQLLLVNTTNEYYDRVAAIDPDVKDFYRYFQAPGIYHCFGGPGYMPGNPWRALIDWVENGRAPEVLEGTSPTGAKRPICLYPKVAQYVGGDPQRAESYTCADDFGTRTAGGKWHSEL